jgi:hypothetical protein
LFGAALLAFAVSMVYMLRMSVPAPQESATLYDETTVGYDYSSTAPSTPATVDLPQTAPRARAEVTGDIPLEIAQAVPATLVPARPTWVDAPPGRAGNDYIATASVGPHATRALCDRDMTAELRRVTDEFIERLIGEPGAAARVALPLARIQRDIVQEEYQEPVQASFGPMIKLHARLKFDKRMQDTIESEHRQALMHERLRHTAAGAGLLLALVGTLFGYLKLDTLTKGYYSGRLKLAAAAAILSAVAASAAVLRGADLPLWS